MKCVIGGPQLRGTGTPGSPAHAEIGAGHRERRAPGTRRCPQARPRAEHDPWEQSGGSASPSSQRDRAAVWDAHMWEQSAGFGDSQVEMPWPGCVSPWAPPEAQLESWVQHSVGKAALPLPEANPRALCWVPLCFLGFHLSRCPVSSQAFHLLNVLFNGGVLPDLINLW